MKYKIGQIITDKGHKKSKNIVMKITSIELFDTGLFDNNLDFAKVEGKIIERCKHFDYGQKVIFSKYIIDYYFKILNDTTIQKL